MKTYLLNLTCRTLGGLMFGALALTLGACSDSNDKDVETPATPDIEIGSSDDVVTVICDPDAFSGRVQEVNGEETRASVDKVLTPIKWIKTPADTLSATSVYAQEFTIDGEKKTYAYVSYHTRGENIGGCLEILDVTDDNITILQQLQTAYPREFNYVIVTTGKRLRAVGSSRKGGQFFNVALSTSTHLFEESDKLNAEWQENQIKLDEGFGDGNWVSVVNDKAYMVTSTHGQSMYGVDLPVRTYQNYYRPNSIVKGVDVINKSNIVNGKQLDITAVLRLENSDGSEAEAYVDVYETRSLELSSDKSELTFDLEQPLYTYRVTDADGNPKKVSPVNGKNGIKVFGNGGIITALGRGGLVKYYRENTGSGTNQVFGDTFGYLMEYPTADSKLATPGSLIVNDLDMDNNYIYAATSSGVIVLTKSDFKEVAKYQWKDPDSGEVGSANFVRLVNDKIYVAYGKSGLIVFQLDNATN